jgi:hypothetical protein
MLRHSPSLFSRLCVVDLRGRLLTDGADTDVGVEAENADVPHL